MDDTASGTTTNPADTEQATDQGAPIAVDSAEAILPQVGDVTPHGVVFGVRVSEGAVFVQFAQSGDWLPA
jgi:hypothetical protein